MTDSRTARRQALPLQRAGGRESGAAPSAPGAPVGCGSGGSARSGGSADGDVVYRNDRTLVRRVPRLDGSGTTIVKQALGPQARARTYHERGLLERLDGVDGVPRVLASRRDDLLLLSDVGGRSLAEFVAASRLADRPVPLTGRALVRTALRLAQIIAGTHAAGVLHRDVNPWNVVVREEPDGAVEPYLVDFDLATTFTQVKPSFLDAREIVGRLPYLAPEQTGRTGQPVDQRADLYGLGATLYELATGSGPFRSDDPLQLLRAILTVTPTPLTEANPDAPAPFARIVARLLEKEPGARYQSAAGLVHDLLQVLAGAPAGFDLGARDFPARLTAPGRLVGRDHENRELAAALDRAVRDAAQVVLVSGGAGTGKSALISQLRPLAAVRGGWFVAGAADRYHRDAAGGILGQALGTLGGLLLTEPQAELDRLRRAVHRAVGENAGLLAGLAPQLEQLLGTPAESGEGPQALGRLRRAVPDLLGGIVSAERPLVMVLDDLQWADDGVLQILDGLLDAGGPGLLVVGAYRDEAADEAHPLTAMRNRWRRLGLDALHLHLSNLPDADLATLLAEMLRTPAVDVTELAGLVQERTAGNPFDTVELVNALRRDGALTLGDDGWRWDARSLRQYIGTGDVVDLLQDRLDRLPPASRETVEVMACLGHDVDQALLATAAGVDEAELVARLLPAFDDGLLLPDDGTVLRFGHERVQQAAYEGIDPAARQELGLGLARRLAAAARSGGEESRRRPAAPETRTAAAAARQYLHVVDRLTDPHEQRAVVGLLRDAAAAARRASNPVAVQEYLAAAATLHERSGGTPEDATGQALDVARHAALYALGRLPEADELFQRISVTVHDPLDLVPAASVQLSSLTYRGRPQQALDLGLALLARLGVPTPDGDVTELAATVTHGYDRVEAWLATSSPESDLDRPVVADRRARAVAQILSRLCTPAFFTDHLLLGWLVTRSTNLWSALGPQAELVPCLGHANARALGLRPTMDLDRALVRRALVVGEARGHQPMTAYTHFLHAVVVGHWFEPVEDVVAEAHAARDMLVQAGDPHTGCFCFYPSISGILDSAATLDSTQAEAEAGLTLAERTGVGNVADGLVWYRGLARALRGGAHHDPAAAATAAGDTADADALAPRFDPVATAHRHVTAAIAAVVAGDGDALVTELTAVEPLIRTLAGTYSTATVELLRGISAATSGDEALLARARDAVKAFAVSAPANFRHLALLLDAELAALRGDVEEALGAYDHALRAADAVVRPWHHAVIAERAGLYHLRSGLSRSGRTLLAEARWRYRNWGAEAKVHALDQAYPDLRDVAAPHARESASARGSSSLTSDTLDMMAILAASQAIGSQTDLDQLRTVLVDQLRSLTGATSVRLVVRDAESGAWLLQPERAGADPVPVDAAAASGLLSLPAFRYSERTREPLLVGDAVRDDRFARDPYLAGLDRCSLLTVPILGGGELRAVLLLANSLSSGAFTTDRLDAVQLLAGQLSVSLDNALLYRSLEAKVAARTRDLEEATRQLERLSITDALTGVANRRRFDDTLAAEWTSAALAARSLALVMVDIDHFKQYNDALGHLAGDQCIRQVAAALLAATPESNLVARYGGEEFAVVLPAADVVDAAALAERFRLAVRERGLAHPNGGPLTISAGAAALTPVAAEDPHRLVADADRALYQAKREGRDRVSVAAPD